MTSTLSKNLSHRRLIKQRTNEMLDYHRCMPKTTKNLPAQVIDISSTLALQKDHETSINLDGSLDTSLSKRLRSKISSKSRGKRSLVAARGKEQQASATILRRPSLRNFKSVDAISGNLESPSVRRTSFSVKKLLKMQATASQSKLTSMENFEASQQPRKNKQPVYFVPKSENDLKQTLKKCTVSKLKLRCKDPFEKRTRLDIQFQDQSAIDRRDQSLMSSLNQQQFRDLLQKLV